MPIEALPLRLARGLRRLVPPLRRLRDLLVEGAHFFRPRRVLRALGMLFLLALGLATLRLVPLVYGRFALVHAARIAARQSRLRGEEQVLRELRNRAFDLGFPEAALDPEAFTLHSELTEAGPTCTIAYRFTHRVKVYGAFGLPLVLEGKVSQFPVEPLPSAPGPLD